MDINTILIAVAIVGGTGIFIGLFLGFADKIFAVKTDPKEEAIMDVLPGNNCGGCGFAGCASLAKAIAGGKAPCGQCPVGGDPVAGKISEIMGTKAEKTARKVAHVRCIGSCDRTKEVYHYVGLESCKAVTYMQNGGPKACTYGCLGYGDCVKVCDFHAINVANGIAYCDWKLCRGCGKCVEACPRNLISLTPFPTKYQVLCNSKDPMKAVKEVCEFGCVGCKACEKVCPSGAITVTDNHATIDPTKCTQCGLCSSKCPRNIIH